MIISEIHVLSMEEIKLEVRIGFYLTAFKSLTFIEICNISSMHVNKHFNIKNVQCIFTSYNIDGLVIWFISEII